jgi:hypothetical protein
MDCPICLEAGKDSIFVKTECNHYFHKECLLEWLNVKKTCPMCRMDLRNTEYNVKYKRKKMKLVILNNCVKLYNYNQEYYLYFTGIRYIKYNLRNKIILEVKNKLLFNHKWNDNIEEKKLSDFLRFIKIYSDNKSTNEIFDKMREKMM